jgi:hypothetical protein
LDETLKNFLPSTLAYYIFFLFHSHAERTEEHKDLCKALSLIKDMIAAVDLKVNEYEKNQKWLEILNKIENKTYTKLKNGHVFRKPALISKERTLLYDGLVYWKTATGRFKGTVAQPDQFLLRLYTLFIQHRKVFKKKKKKAQNCRQLQPNP